MLLGRVLHLPIAEKFKLSILSIQPLKMRQHNYRVRSLEYQTHTSTQFELLDMKCYSDIYTYTASETYLDEKSVVHNVPFEST